MDTAFRFTEWQQATGLTPNRFTADPMAADARKALVKPEFMWHALFWLPPRFAGRYHLPSGPDGAFEAESAAIRYPGPPGTTASGLYSFEDGWLDVLATVGIDVENEIDLARIEEWQAGGVDNMLDSIDPDLYLALENNPNWALQSAMAPADSLTDVIMDAYDDEANTPLHKVRDTPAVVASLSCVQLDEVPTDDEEQAQEFWDPIKLEARDGNYATVQEFVDGPATDAMAWLTLTRDTYWESVENLQSLQATQQA